MARTAVPLNFPFAWITAVATAACEICVDNTNNVRYNSFTNAPKALNMTVAFKHGTVTVYQYHMCSIRSFGSGYGCTLPISVTSPPAS